MDVVSGGLSHLVLDVGDGDGSMWDLPPFNIYMTSSFFLLFRAHVVWPLLAAVLPRPVLLDVR